MVRILCFHCQGTGQGTRNPVSHVAAYSHCKPSAQSLSHVRLFVTPWTVAHQAPLSMGILQARILEWFAMPSSGGYSQSRDRTQVSHIVGGFFTI